MLEENKKLKITFLVDSPQNWMVKHVRKLISKIQAKYIVNLIHDSKNINNGDILFILSFYKLVPKEILILNKTNIVIHASNLPKGKGWSPATWQIIENKDKIPLTLFEATSKVDGGPIYFKDSVDLDGTELIKEWQDKMGKKIIKMIIKFINCYPDIKAKSQLGEKSFYPKRTPKDSQLDIDKSIKEQFNLLRVVDNNKYPAFFEYKGNKFIVKIFKG